MEVTNVHVGKQLQVSYSVQGATPNPPTVYGFGNSAVPGTGFFNGGILVGSPITYPIPNVPEATVMIGRAEPVSNPLASVAPSILKVSSRASAVPGTQAGTPIDVLFGDPTGPVGFTMFGGIQPFTVEAGAINLYTIAYDLFSAFRAELGASTDIGPKVFGGAKMELGFDSNFSLAYNAAPVFGLDVPDTKLDFVSPLGWTLASVNAEVKTKKSFDIPHPTKKEHRLRHVCLEGPEAGVYVRGRLTGKNVIELPEYWRGLVDAETITVTLTQIKTSQDLIVDGIEWGTRIKVRSGNGTDIDCFYHVQAERKDGEKLIPEYKGTSIEDYPGNNAEYSHNK